jgi:hypothetical protein
MTPASRGALVEPQDRTSARTADELRLASCKVLPVADERCPYAHGPLVARGPRVDGKHGVDKDGNVYDAVMICPQCEHFFAVKGIREIVEVQLS